jgi:hypothetical protein
LEYDSAATGVQVQDSDGFDTISISDENFRSVDLRAPKGLNFRPFQQEFL